MKNACGSQENTGTSRFFTGPGSVWEEMEEILPYL